MTVVQWLTTHHDSSAVVVSAEEFAVDLVVTGSPTEVVGVECTTQYHLGTWGCGDMEMWDVGTWGCEDEGTWECGDDGTWGYGDEGTWGYGDVVGISVTGNMSVCACAAIKRMIS